MNRRVLAVCFLAFCLASVAAAGGGWAGTYSLAGRSVALTNEQANSTWVPVAVLWRFDVATNAAITVERVSQGNAFVLGATSVSNATSAVWVPEAEYPFAVGDVLRIGCTVTNGVVQVIRKGD